MALSVGKGRQAGLVVLPLRDVGLAAAAETYRAIQGPRFAPMGINDEEVTVYSRYLTAHAAKCPASVAVVDSDGSVVGLSLFLAKSPSSEGLFGAAKEHRDMVLSLGREVAKLAPGEHLIESAFGGSVPQYQGKGLLPWMERVGGSAARLAGLGRCWSWTLNPLMLKAQGKGDSRIALLISMAELVLKLPAPAVNWAVLPLMGAAGVLPREYTTVVVPAKRYPIAQRTGPKTDIVIAVMPFKMEAGTTSSPETIREETVLRADTAAALPHAKL
eukprot:Hpha_TRINITY_DN4374_c0_g1::TRINITY_DN4374_c0_g1_i1::g.50223::m.50223